MNEEGTHQTKEVSDRPSRPTSSSTYIPLQPFAPFGHRLISQVLRLNLITASGSFPTVFHLQH